MNPDTPAAGRANGNSTDTPAAQTPAAASSMGPGLGSPLGPAEYADGRMEGGFDEAPGGFLHSVKRNATSQLNAQKRRATDQLDNFTATLRESTQQLRDERHDAVATLLERGVAELERLTTTLRERDINEFIADVERFGRRQPALFLGSSFVAGLLLARFAKASEPGSGWNGRSRSSYNPYNTSGHGLTGQESL
jgi:uncharacterized membrane protein